VFEVTARSAADILGIHPNSDESYFCGRRKGRCGRSAAGKEVVFGVLKRNGRVCQILQDIGFHPNLRLFAPYQST